ncbi:unnamed protein product [Moneuplotes crassus]|uniref:Uncharacterized protein n=2 Tax=Euplotes crassus TaxID=5936 RepID=A0AAD1Y368_EUPCR|nr:unnamed protein product [Moneuplotes crassus]
MGIWAMSKIGSQPMIKELLYNDQKDIRESVLYILAEMDTLKWFKYALFCGSYQDNYSPLESSLVQYSPRLDQVKQKETISEMCEMINASLSQVDVYKTCVNLKFSKKSFNTIIGRRAHIEYLQNSDVLRIIISKYKDIFVTVE